jgi:hypothetical protein
MKQEIQNPFWEALKELTRKPPPKFALKISSSAELTDDQHYELQSFGASYSRVPWSTGIGLIDAADLIVAQAVSNGNIEYREPQGTLYLYKFQWKTTDSVGVHLAVSSDHPRDLTIAIRASLANVIGDIEIAFLEKLDIKEGLTLTISEEDVYPNEIMHY